jgi:hypothetical protein
MPEVDPGDVTSLQSGDVDVVVPLVTVMAKSYTRGRGFVDGEPVEDVAAAIATASARLAANGAQLRRKRIDDVEYEYSLRTSFEWSLAEQIVLNRYRVRAM